MVFTFIVSTVGIFEKFVMNSSNATFAQTSYTSRAGSPCYVGLDFCVHLTVEKPHFDVLTATCNFESTRILMTFPFRIVACPFCSSINSSCEIMEGTSPYVHSSMAAAGESSGTILCYMGDIPGIQLSIFVSPSKLFDVWF